MPLDAAAVVVPESVALPGFASRAIATDPPKPVAVLPRASRAVTVTAGETALPAVTFVGWVVKTRVAAAPGDTLNPALVAPGRPLALATRVLPVPGRSRLRVENVAT